MNLFNNLQYNVLLLFLPNKIISVGMESFQTQQANYIIKNKKKLTKKETNILKEKFKRLWKN